MRQGRLIDLFYDDDAYVFARQDRNETVIIAINRADKEKKVTVPAGAIDLKDGAELGNLIGKSANGIVAKGQATLSIPRRTAAAYRVR
jgi:hypothetical protein